MLGCSSVCSCFGPLRCVLKPCSFRPISAHRDKVQNDLFKWLVDVHGRVLRPTLGIEPWIMGDPAVNKPTSYVWLSWGWFSTVIWCNMDIPLIITDHRNHHWHSSTMLKHHYWPKNIMNHDQPSLPVYKSALTIISHHELLRTIIQSYHSPWPIIMNHQKSPYTMTK